MQENFKAQVSALEQELAAAKARIAELEDLYSKPRKPFKNNPSDCKHESAILMCNDCGINFRNGKIGQPKRPSLEARISVLKSIAGKLGFDPDGNATGPDYEVVVQPSRPILAGQPEAFEALIRTMEIVSSSYDHSRGYKTSVANLRKIWVGDGHE